MKLHAACKEDDVTKGLPCEGYKEDMVVKSRMMNGLTRRDGAVERTDVRNFPLKWR